MTKKIRTLKLGKMLLVLTKKKSVFLTNCARSFHKTCLFEIGLSDFDKVVLTNPQSKSEPLPPKTIRYRTYEQFDEGKFKNVSQNYLSELNSSELSVDVFKMSFLNALKILEPVRKK